MTVDRGPSVDRDANTGVSTWQSGLLISEARGVCLRRTTVLLHAGRRKSQLLL